jgi:uncharacterized damage-inducible protein DinB
MNEFRRYKELGEKAMAQLPDDKLNWQYNEGSNSVAVIVKHMAGNMLSRWTDIFHSDGEKEWRKRDEEFNPEELSRTELMALWEKGWACLFSTLTVLHEEDLERTIYIRGEAHTVTRAIIRQLSHYPHHVGQIMYIAKMVLDDQWHSLSIPKNKSDEFNQQMFSRGKQQ